MPLLILILALFYNSLAVARKPAIVVPKLRSELNYLIETTKDLGRYEKDAIHINDKDVQAGKFKKTSKQIDDEIGNDLFDKISLKQGAVKEKNRKKVTRPKENKKTTDKTRTRRR